MEGEREGKSERRGGMNGEGKGGREGGREEGERWCGEEGVEGRAGRAVERRMFFDISRNTLYVLYIFIYFK